MSTPPPETIEDYIAVRTVPVRKILKTLQSLVHKTLPESKEGMKWGAPVFFNQSGDPVVYLYGGKDNANLGFINGADFDDPKELLKGSGKSGRHVEIFADKPLPKKALVEFLKQCE